MLRITTIATPGSGSEFRTGASGVKVGDETTHAVPMHSLLLGTIPLCGIGNPRGRQNNETTAKPISAGTDHFGFREMRGHRELPAT
jgi:hypothetical protein